MPSHGRQRVFYAVLMLAGLVSVCGCSIIAGKDDADQALRGPLNITFVETLRNEKSLAGESYRELPEGKNVSTSLLKLPGSVYADQFRVYVTETVAPGSLIIFDRGTRTAAALNIVIPASSVEGRLLAPAGVAVDAAGIIFVSDSQQGRVFGYDRNGTVVMVLGRPQAFSAEGLGDLTSPRGLAIDNSRNRIYVADSHAQQIKVFTTAGIHLFDIANTGNREQDFRFPEAVTIDRNGTLYVLDSQRRRVFVFTGEGKFIRSFSLKNGVPGRPTKPKGIAVDSEGHIYVPDAVNNNVLVYNNDGSFLLPWGRTGRLIGDFWTPTGIFIDDHDYIYIVDQTNSRIQTFQFMK